MNLSYYDLHCDTLYERYRNPDRPKHLDLAGDFARRRQIYAIWSQHGLSSDEMYRRFFEIVDTVPMPADGALAVEGGELLGDDITRLDAIAAYHPVYLTLVWRDICPIGGGWNTDVGLTDFGRAVVRRLDELGIIPDLSHASDAMFYEVAEMTDTFIATHSDSRAVCPHGRNLTDEMFGMIRDAGGIVGINLCPEHLSADGHAGISDVMAHIEHYLALGGEHTICFGCDFDGIGQTPEGLNGPGDLPRIADAMARAGYSDALIGRIFYDNANNYFEKRRNISK